jgi:hypothetical protein
MKRFLLLLLLALFVLTLGYYLFGRVKLAVDGYVQREYFRPNPKIFSTSCKVRWGSGSPGTLAGWDFQAQQLSTEPTKWQGTPGAAVTIRFEAGPKQLEQFEGMQSASFGREPLYPCMPGTLGILGYCGVVNDFAVPVMKLEPRAMTLFFSNDGIDYRVLNTLCDQLEEGTLRVTPAPS